MQLNESIIVVVVVVVIYVGIYHNGIIDAVI